MSFIVVRAECNYKIGIEGGDGCGDVEYYGTTNLVNSSFFVSFYT